MAPSFLSLVSLYAIYLRRCYSAAGLASQTLQISNDTTIHFWGPKPDPNRNSLKPKPTLLLLHGFGPEAIWQWGHQVQFLAPLFHVYVPDLLFFGKSWTGSDQRSEVFQAVSMGKLMDELRIEKFHVVGTSYGGFVAYRMAQMWPEKVEKVVIASSGVDMRKEHNEGLLERANCQKVEEVLLPATAAQLRTLMGLAVSWRLDVVPDFLFNDIVHTLYSENRKEKMQLLKGLTLGRDETPSLTPLNQDVLIVWGEHDQIFPLKMAYDIKEVLGEKAKLQVIKDASHVPQSEQATEFNKINIFLTPINVKDVFHFTLETVAAEKERGLPLERRMVASLKKSTFSTWRPLAS